MRWNPLSLFSTRKLPRRKPITRKRLALEELESRLVPSTDVTGYNPASPTLTPASSINAGINTNETVLTPANVTAATFGKLFSTNVDGQVYAQPLYMENVNISTGSHQGTHNVVLVATENDSLYAIDSASGTILWQDALLTATHGGTPSSIPNGEVGTGDIAPLVGITATPVIDPNNNTIFVEAKQKEIASDGTHYEHYLYAVNIASGAITNKVLIADSIGDTVVSGPSVLGTGAGSSGGVVKFDALRQLDRPGLILVNGNIYLAYASHGDNGPYHGWILGYAESNLALTAVFNANPNGNDDGIWQAGGILAYETVAGNTFLYFETGNGTFDTTLTASPFTPGLMIPNKGDYGDSFVKVQIDSTTSQPANNINGWGMHVVDYFTPSNEGNLSNGDTDLGSGAPLLLPASAGSAAHPSLMVGSGKEGRLYLIDRNNMGGYHGDAAGDGNSGFDNVVQETTTGAITSSLDTPVFLNGVLYYVGGYNNDVAKTFDIANGVISSSAVTRSTDTYPFPGSTPTISMNGTSNGIVWDIAGPGTNQLRAYDASQGYAKEIYTSAQASGSRDSFGSAVKFTVPTVADGEVFVGTTNSLVGYGLLQQATAAPAAPTGLIATAFSGSVINLNWTDHDVAPNTASAFNILESVNGGAFTQVGTASAGATSFAVGGLQISTTYSFEVTASNSKGTSVPTNIATATTTSQASTLDFSSGFGGSNGVLTYNGNAILNGTSAELTDGGATEAGSVFSTNAVDVTKFSTQFTFQLTSAQADGFTFTIQGNGPTALGQSGGALGYQGIANSMAIKFDLYDNNGEGTDSTGEFTGGVAPFTPAIDLSSSGIQLNSGDVFKVVMGYDGTTLNVTITDVNTGKSASQSYTVNIPQVIGRSTGFVGFTGGTGGLSAVQNILTWAYSPTASTIPGAPSNLTGTVISGNEIDISWTDNANNETGFLIDRSTDGGTTYSQIATVGANVTTYHDTSLSPGQTVFYKVQATNAAGNSAFTNPPFQAKTEIPPPPPTNVHVTNITATEVDLAWTNVATNATGIKILKQLGSNSSQVVTSLPATATSYNITGLTPGTPWLFEIDAQNSSGPSGAAEIQVDTLPAQVTGVTATAGPGQITINWAVDTGAVSYSVYRSTTPGGEGATPSWSGIAGTSYIDNTATPGTTYYYEVTAVDGDAASPPNPAGETGKSAEVSAVAQTNSAGINFGSGFTGATGLTLNGGASISGSSLQITDGGGTEARSAFANTAQAIGTFSTQFTFQITGGSNPTADGFTFTIQGNGPTALGPSGGGLGYGPDNTGGAAGIAKSVAIKFDLYSNQGEGVDSTGLYLNGVAPTNVGSLDMTGSVDLHSGDLMQVNLTYDGTNLTETIKDTVTGATFTHTYSGVNIASTVGGTTAFVGFTGGTGGLTAVQNVRTWTFTPGSSSTLGAPSNLVDVVQNGPQVQLTWNDNSTSETGFAIQRATDAAFSQNVINFTAPANSTASATFTDTSTVASTTYFYRVQAVQGTTTSAFSNPVTAIIPAPPGTPTNGHATLITTTEVDLAWTDNATNEDVYKIFREVVGSSFSLIATLPANTTSYKDTGLTPGTNYDYHIEAWNVSNNSDRTGADLFTISPAITNLAATAGVGQVALSWTAPPAGPVTTYNVYRGTSANGENVTPIATGLTATSYTDTTAASGTTYFYEVTSVDSQSLATPNVAPFGESARSNEVSATVQGSGTVGTGTGLTGQYFNDMTLTNLVLTRTDPTVNFDWGSGSPDPSVPVDHFSVRWTGQVQAQFSENYTFYTDSDDGVRLWVNGQEIINDWTDHANTEDSATINLVAGQKYDIKMEYYENGGLADAKLLWSSPSTAKQAIPISQLYVAAAANFVAHINFSSSTTEVPAGYINDIGLAYGPRSNGMTFGWSADNTGNARDRNAANSPDELHDSLIHMQTPTNTAQKFTWSIAVPNGTYSVHVLTGDPSNADVISKLTVNGVLTVSGSTSSTNLWLQGTSTITVTTGQITVAEQAGAYDKIDEIDIVQQAAVPAINFASGFSTTTGVTLNGSAQDVANALQLTDTTANNEAGSAFTTTQQGVGKFTTTFNFQTTASASTADGFAFVIQNVAATALGPSGGGLGFGPDAPGGAAGIGSSIALKFDLYNNAAEGVDSTGLFTNGQSPTTGGIAPATGSLDFTGTLDLHSGHVFTTTVSYDGTTLTVKTTDTTTNAAATQTYLVNIPGIVGGSSAFVGFTGGTGGVTATQNILNWTFTPQ